MSTRKKENISEQKKVKLGYRVRDAKYKKEYAALKIKIALNRIELFALFVIIATGLHFTLNLTNWQTKSTPLVLSITLSLVITFYFYKYKKYQITITRFDKENIYKKISKDLLEDKN